MSLETLLLGNPLSAWLNALGLALALNLAAAICKSVALRRLPQLARRTSTSLDDAAIELVRATRQGLILMVTLYLGSRTLQLPERMDTALRVLATVATFVQVGLWLTAALKQAIDASCRRAAGDNLGATTTLGALYFVGQLLIWSMALLLALANLGIDVSALIAGLGVGGIAVALAVQNILGDLFASLSIVVDKPFVVGDFIIVDDMMGTVEQVGLKTTRLRSLSGEQLIFSNGDLLKSRVRNYKRMQERRAVFGFGVVYGTTPAQLSAIPKTVRSIVEAMPGIRFDRAHFKSFGESSLDFEVVYWMLDPDYNKYMDVQQAINLALMEALAHEGVEFAFPTRTVVFEKPITIQRMPRITSAATEEDAP